MPRVDQRQGVWFYFFLFLMIFGGFCAIGFWQTYDINCGGFGANKSWSFAKFPPGYVCRGF